jgi:hypothetical protein
VLLILERCAYNSLTVNSTVGAGQSVLAACSPFACTASSQNVSGYLMHAKISKVSGDFWELYVPKQLTYLSLEKALRAPQCCNSARIDTKPLSQLRTIETLRRPVPAHPPSCKENFSSRPMKNSGRPHYHTNSQQQGRRAQLNKCLKRSKLLQ